MSDLQTHGSTGLGQRLGPLVALDSGLDQYIQALSISYTKYEPPRNGFPNESRVL